jgi:ankyrin repeat protein
VLACLAAGFPVNSLDANGATAAHYASIWGRAGEVRALIQADADLSIRDPEHHATPLGWAVFGADYYLNSPGDYPATVRALVDAGSPPLANDEYISKRADVRAALVKT